VWRPGEADVSIRPGWFWHPAQDDAVRSADDLVELYFSSVGRNAGLLLNVPPTTRGLLHDADVRSLAAFGTRLRDLYAVDLAAGARVSASGAADRARAAGRIIEPDPDTYWQPPPVRGEAAPWIELEWPRPVSFDVVCAQEAIAHGQQVASHSIEAWHGRGWMPIVGGLTIGYKRLHRFPTITTTRLRLAITSSLATPRVGRLAAHRLRG
jgi:alpha-L-fucosidase